MKDRHYSEFLLYIVGYNATKLGSYLNEMKEMQGQEKRWDNFDECLQKLIEDYRYKYGIDLVFEMGEAEMKK